MVFLYLQHRYHRLQYHLIQQFLQENKFLLLLHQHKLQMILKLMKLNHFHHFQQLNLM